MCDIVAMAAFETLGYHSRSVILGLDTYFEYGDKSYLKSTIEGLDWDMEFLDKEENAPERWGDILEEEASRLEDYL